MILTNTVKWNQGYQHDGLLFFAQRIVEMLDYATIDIFRAPLLNTCSLVDEYLKIYHGYAKGYHLDEVFNEFINSFISDIVIHHNWGDERITQITNKLHKEQSNRQEIMEYICHTVGSHYLEWVKNYIRYIVPQNHEKRKIERAIRCFIPELLRCGYSRDEVYHSAKQMIFDNIDPKSALDGFLSRYDQRKKKYTVYTALSNRLSIFEDTLKARLGICFEDDGNFAKIEIWDNYFAIKTNTIEALDASTAAENAFKSIELFTSFYQFYGDYSGRLIQNRVLVISEAGEERSITVDRGKYTAIEDANPPRIGELAELSITNIIHSAYCSLPELQKIIRLHNRAIANNGLENGFLNLWSILEVICVTDPEASKINQVISIAIPILKRDYLPILFGDITNNLKRILEPAQYSALLTNVNVGDKEYEKIASLLLLPEYSDLLSALVDNLCAYPVLRTRMLNLHDDCTKRNNLYNLTEHYAQRISWHIYRIYRARNAIVHSGKRPTALKDLGEHLHAYVDSVAKEVIIKLSSGTLCHISNVLVDSELQHEKWSAYFSTTAPLEHETIKLLFSFQMNTWGN